MNFGKKMEIFFLKNDCNALIDVKMNQNYDVKFLGGFLFKGLRLFETLEYILYSTKFICRQLTVFETLGLKKVVACILEVIANVE